MTSPTQYYYSDVLGRLFSLNQKVTTVEEFWEVIFPTFHREHRGL